MNIQNQILIDSPRKVARLRKRSMVASENTSAGDPDADGVLALPENVRQFAHSLPS